MSERYARQTILPEIGAAGQARIEAARVLVVGAGGLGAPVLQYLAGAGTGTLVLADPDCVDRSNLHRQTLFGESVLGRPKVDAAASVLRDLNPEVTLRPLRQRVDPASVAPILADVDLVLDCADSFAVSYTLSDACQARGLPLVSASALAMSGYVGGFCGGAPSLRAVFPDLPERAASCATAGVLGPVVGVLGALQAQMALQVILRHAPSPLGQVVTFDGDLWRFGGFRFDGAPEPAGPVLRFVGEAQIEPDDFVVDLRGPEEAPAPVRPEALRCRAEDFGAGGPMPREGQRAVLCCRSGLRSWRAARRLERVWPGEVVLVALGDP